MKWLRIKLCKFLIALCDYGEESAMLGEDISFFCDGRDKVEAKLRKLTRGDV